ncbi:MAG: hypothetical protein WDN49_20275 [Acetobacteraceae bacterium]
MKPLIPAHHGSSSRSAKARMTAVPTESAAMLACRARGPDRVISVASP